jgi:hypothetical protein
LPDKVLTAELGIAAAAAVSVCELPPVEGTKLKFAVYDGVDRTYGVKTLPDEHGRGVILSIATRDSSTREWDEWENFRNMPGATRQFSASPYCNPVLHDGSLYILGTDGRLLVVCYEKKSGYGSRPEIIILEKPHGFPLRCHHRYLFESDRGELMAVLVGFLGSSVNVV